MKNRTFALLLGLAAALGASPQTIVYKASDFTSFVHTRGIIDNVPAGAAHYATAPASVVTDCLTAASDPRILDDGGQRQRTHVTEHLVYARPGETIYLTPYTDFYDRTQYQENLVRWYDYATDEAHPWLTMYYSNNRSLHFPWGIVGGTAIGGNRQHVSVGVLTIPANADFSDRPIIIAMDASQDATRQQVGGARPVWTEPTVNFRHLFLIYDARQHAADYSHTAADNTRFTRERCRNITARAGVDFHVRLNYKLPSQNGYASGMLYEADDASGTNRRIGTAYLVTTTADPSRPGEKVEVDGMFALSDVATTFEGTSALKSFARTITCPAAKAQPGTYTVRLYARDTAGRPVYVRGTGGTVPLIVQEYEITFVGDERASFYNEEQLAARASALSHQTYDYLNSHYGQPVATVDYDELPLTGDLVSNSASTAKYYRWPVAWDDSDYAFGYQNRHDYNEYVLATHSSVTPYHKGADNWPAASNYPGSACNPTGLAGQFDRLFYDTHGERQGYFYYVNGAGDPGVVARLRIKDLCLGSTLYVTGWVTEMSATDEKANLIFNFNARLTDGRSVTLHSFTTGYIPTVSTTILGSLDSSRQIYCGKWTRAYYSFVPNTAVTGLTADQIDYYELSLENNCVNSNGADYAIDDIRIWVSKPEVHCQQMRPICNDEKETEVKVSANFQSLLSTVGRTPAASAADGEVLTCYYTFLDKALYDSRKAALAGDPNAASLAFDAAIVRYPYNPADPRPDQGFGTLRFNTFFASNRSFDASGDPSIDAMREVVDGTEYLIFCTTPYDADLYPGKEYIVALWSPPLGQLLPEEENEAYILQASNFDINDVCAKVCVFRVTPSGVVKVNGTLLPDQDEFACCDNQYPVIQIDAWGMLPEAPAEMTILEENACYDWFMGSMAEYLEAASPEGIRLEDALVSFREYYGETADIAAAVPRSDHSDAALQPISLSQSMLDYLTALATTPDATGRIRLQLARRSCVMALGAAAGPRVCHAVAVPIIREQYIVGGTTYDSRDILICTAPTEVRVFVEAHSPLIAHGFAHDVLYPDHIEDVALRIGLGQLQTVSRPHAELLGFYPGSAAEASLLAQPVLTVPLRRAESSEANYAVSRLCRTSDAVVYLAETNDPEYSALPLTPSPINPYPDAADDALRLPQVGVLLELQASTDAAQILADNDFLRLTFSRNFIFKEGYYYRLLFGYSEEYPADYTGERTACLGQHVMTLKVVPKFLKWTADAGNTDWNNDRNWRRISSAELLHDFTGPDDPLRPFLTDDAPSSLAYAPLDFTDVLLPATAAYPRLYERPANIRKVGTREGTHRYTWLWPQGDADGESALLSTATPCIQYDMAAWNSPRGVGCRPWYANTCEHVTFLPGAALHAQQLLSYQRAWVEMELAKDRWYTLTSPLQTTVAGDYYLPTAGRSAARQMTEHFLPITYDPALNDRFRPAVYQRAWDHADATARIFRMDHDGLYGTDANIDYAYVEGTWSHVFNDVAEPCSQGRGFSILTDVDRLPGADDIDRVLFRLPKDDGAFFYHSADALTPDGAPYTGDLTSIDRSVDGTTQCSTPAYLDNGRQVYRPAVPCLSRLNPTSGVITVGTATEGHLFLVGNPFMTYLDMAAFFDANPVLERKYWIVTEGRQDVAIMGDDACSLSTTGVPTAVAPMQAFFVETKMPARRLDLVYNEQMMCDTPATDQPAPLVLRAKAAEAPGLRLQLLDPAGTPISTAVIALSPTASAAYSPAEDAILLRDANLADAPVVFTVADSTALTINVLDRLAAPIPLGITVPCAAPESQPSISSTHPKATPPEAATATLVITGTATVDAPLYLLDAIAGTVVPIVDGQPIAIVPGAVGRYSLTTVPSPSRPDSTPAATAVYNLHGLRTAATAGPHILITQGRTVLRR